MQQNIGTVLRQQRQQHCRSTTFCRSFSSDQLAITSTNSGQRLQVTSFTFSSQVSSLISIWERFSSLLSILVTSFLTNQWWLNSTEVFVSFLLNSKSPFLPGWFPLFRRLCKWTRLPHSSWGRKKSPKRNQLAGWVMVKPDTWAILSRFYFLC